jgi:hypothetical protein
MRAIIQIEVHADLDDAHPNIKEDAKVVAATAAKAAVEALDEDRKASLGGAKVEWKESISLKPGG